MSEVKRQAPPCFTREQTTAIKQLVGMDEFYPTIWETQQAGKIFKERLSEYKQDVALGKMKAETAIDIAACEVWSRARRYQSEKQPPKSAQTTEHAEPNGIKRPINHARFWAGGVQA